MQVLVLCASSVHGDRAWADPKVGGGGGAGGLTPGLPLVITMAIGFLRNTGTDPPREAIGPLGSNCFSRVVRELRC